MSFDACGKNHTSIQHETYTLVGVLMGHFVILKREELQITTFSFFSELKSLQ